MGGWFDIAVPTRFTLRGRRGGCIQVLQAHAGYYVVDDVLPCFFFIIMRYRRRTYAY